MAMKSLYSKIIEPQGLNEAFQASIEALVKTLESVFKMLELKGKGVKLFKPNRDNEEILQALHNIKPNIKEEDIPNVEVRKLCLTSKLSGEAHHRQLYMLQY